MFQTTNQLWYCSYRPTSQTIVGSFGWYCNENFINHNGVLVHDLTNNYDNICG